MQERTEIPVIGLSDIDDTMVDTGGNILNEALIEIYLEAEIKDVCLFSSMFYQQMAIDLAVDHAKYTREFIIEDTLKKKYGFNVSLITPSDVVLGTGGEYYEKKYKPVFYQMKNDPDFLTKLQNKDPNVVKKLNDEMRAVDKDIIEADAIMHKDYDDYKKEHKNCTGTEVSEYIQKKYPDKKSKGVMFPLAKQLYPNASMFYTEDREKEIIEVEEANKKLGGQLTTVLIQTTVSKQNITSDLRELNKEALKQKYRLKMIEHFEKLPYRSDNQDRILEKLKKNAKNYNEKKEKDILDKQSQVSLLGTIAVRKPGLLSNQEEIQKAFTKEVNSYISSKKKFVKDFIELQLN